MRFYRTLKAAEEQAKLHNEQLEIEKKFGFKVVGLSLFNTVLEVCNLFLYLWPTLHFVPYTFQCIKNRQPKVAELLRKDFKLTDTQ